MADKSVYKKTINVENKSGDLKRQYFLDLAPWSFEANEEKGTEAVSGFTCKIGVLKLGPSPSNRFVYIDPSNLELRKSLSEMYQEYDKVVKK